MDGLSPAPKHGLYLINCEKQTGLLTYDEIKNHLRTALIRAQAL
jgi:hypothetical protein